MKSVKVFISYSHNDSSHLENFLTHTKALELNGSAEFWYDGINTGGSDFQSSIDANLEAADIVCLFISANFIASTACIKEKRRAIELRKTKGLRVIPIILSQCAWSDDEELKTMLAIPHDGKEVVSYESHDEAWLYIYRDIKEKIEIVSKIIAAKFSASHQEFLTSAGMLEKSHPNKQEVLLKDVFVYPELELFDEKQEYEKTESADKLLNHIINTKRIVIAGESLSGKTSLIKVLCTSLRGLNFFPVYIVDNEGTLHGLIENRVQSSFEAQYEGIDFDIVDKSRVVVFVDNFHLATKKEKHISTLSQYGQVVLVVDDIFAMNMHDQELVSSYRSLRIKELKASLRNSLIEKWTILSDISNTTSSHSNDRYSTIDSTTESVNLTLGKAIGGGIMPAFPFFVLTAMSYGDTLGNNLDKEITSQGYCYQTLIFLYLKKIGVNNEEMDTYINFLTECSFYFFDNNKSKLTKLEFEDFISKYTSLFNMTIKIEILINNIHKTKMLTKDGLGNYLFCYPYLYYFFVAKYLSEHANECPSLISEVMLNLHKNENAYIAIFISHHSRNAGVLDEITLNAMVMFEEYSPATLDKHEFANFDKNIDEIAKQMMPDLTRHPDEGRKELLLEQDEKEFAEELGKPSGEQDVVSDLELELRRGIKTVEVMGLIIKSRSGSLKLDRLEQIFEEGMNVHLRILSSYIEQFVKNEEFVVDYLSKKILALIKERNKIRVETKRAPHEPSKEELEKLASQCFWSLNLAFVHALVSKTVQSLGSNKLLNVVTSVCDKNKSPAAFLIKHGILMWYGKNVQVEELSERMESDDVSQIAKKALRIMVANHCAVHSLDYKDKQKIQQSLDIPMLKLAKKHS